MTTFPDSHKDLLDAQVATLATLGGDGAPQLTEVWFLHDDGEVKLSLNSGRLKTVITAFAFETGTMILRSVSRIRST